MSQYDALPRLDVVLDPADPPEQWEEDGTAQVLVFAQQTRGPFQVWWPELPERPASTAADYDVLELVDGQIVNVTPTAAIKLVAAAEGGTL